ncbi:11906_t:CDS:2, partial [Racocetra fulgida]
ITTQQLLTIDTKNCFQIAVDKYNLKEIAFADLGKPNYVNRGVSGNVYCTSCNSIPSEKVAVKEILISEDNDEKGIKMFLNELKLHSQVSHPQIIKFYGISNAYYLLMEYANDGTLRQYLKSAILSWGKKVELAVQIVEGMLYLHNKKITHRDLVEISGI